AAAASPARCPSAGPARGRRCAASLAPSGAAPPGSPRLWNPTPRRNASPAPPSATRLSTPRAAPWVARDAAADDGKDGVQKPPRTLLQSAAAWESPPPRLAGATLAMLCAPDPAKSPEGAATPRTPAAARQEACFQLEYVSSLSGCSEAARQHCLRLYPREGVAEVAPGGGCARVAVVGRHDQSEAFAAWVPNVGERKCISRRAFEVLWVPGDSSRAWLRSQSSNHLLVDGAEAVREGISFSLSLTAITSGYGKLCGRLFPWGAMAAAGPGAVGGKLTPERRDAMLAMSAEHFEACSIWLSPGQKAHLLGLRAVQTGDPLALSRQAKQQHDTLKDQVAKAKNAWEKAQEVLAKQLQKTAELKAKYVELEAKELEAARAAASAFTELGRASRPQPADPAAYLVEQLRELGVEAGVVDSIKQVAEARQKAKKDEEEAAAAKARDHDLDMDAAIGNLKQGDWLDKLVSSAGEGGITRSQLELAVCFLEALDRFCVFDYVVMDYFATVASDTAERLHKQATQLKIVNWIGAEFLCSSLVPSHMAVAGAEVEVGVRPARALRPCGPGGPPPQAALYLFAMYTNVYCREGRLCICCKRSFFVSSLVVSAIVFWASYEMLRASGEGITEELVHPFLVSRLQSWVVWFPLWFLLPCVGFWHYWDIERRALGR
ncbi:unnamed protein product, partial [Prorocentrum cordatum]